MVVLGIALGMTGSYFFFIRDLGINDRLEIIRQQIAAPAPAPDAKPSAKPSKPRQNH